MIITLTKSEESICKQASNARYNFARSAGLTNQNVVDRSDLDLLGIRGEMAVAKLFDLDWTAHTIGHDDGMDMWFEDCSIDVKTGFENARMLLFRTQEKFKADVAIFCRQTGFDNESIEVVGWINREDFKFKSKKMDLGHGFTWGVEDKNLNKIEVLWKILKQKQLNK
tara:strand:- start:611 stop:1114 length:504 start_codon:yes stop_codon:yes gene_type:complete